jgi:hypothetical protein
MMKNFFGYLHSLNNSRFFAGLVMIMLNVGSKYITIELSKSQEQYLRNTLARQMLIFAISWMGSRDIITALGLTAVFNVLTQHLFNEKSSYCVIPEKWRNFADVIDTNGDGEITQDELNKALGVLEKAKKKEKYRENLRLLNSYNGNI